MNRTYDTAVAVASVLVIELRRAVEARSAMLLSSPAVRLPSPSPAPSPHLQDPVGSGADDSKVRVASTAVDVGSQSSDERVRVLSSLLPDRVRLSTSQLEEVGRGLSSAPLEVSLGRLPPLSSPGSLSSPLSSFFSAHELLNELIMAWISMRELVLAVEQELRHEVADDMSEQRSPDRQLVEQDWDAEAPSEPDFG